MQLLGYLCRHIERGTQVADAQPLLFSQIAEGLRIEQGIGGSIHEAEHIVVSWHRLTTFTPVAHPPEIGTDGQHHGSLCHHGLVEMEGCQCLLGLLRTCDHHAVELQVAHCLGVGSLLQ